MAAGESTEKDRITDKLVQKTLSPVYAFANQMSAAQYYWAGYSKYLNEFMIPFMLSVNYFNGVEQLRLMKANPSESFQAYMDLMGFNLDLFNRSYIASMRVLGEYAKRELPQALTAVVNTFVDGKGEDLETFTARQAKTLENVSKVYPKAIQDVEPEFGFHFERGTGILFAETDRFELYQVLPTREDVKVREDGKPVLIIPPFVLGANILAFLPGENRSYTHCFANQGIPTYIRIMKNIKTTPAVQIMTGEDDALDMQYFCEKIRTRHGKPVTLNGYCQGGFSSVCNLLSGELDGLVDALITCVSPMDGTRSKGLRNFLLNLPGRFNDLSYGTKTLSNGNKVADGLLMGWVYKLKSIEAESPIVAFFRDMMLLTPKNGGIKINKSAAALNYWLQNERTDLPLPITEMSFASYNTPITKDGVLPVTLFDRELRFQRLAEKGVKWLICYGESDDLVEKETALAPADFIDVEISAFPKGHVAIATSWSDPGSACALHTRFGPNNYRGPVRFHLDIEMEMAQKVVPPKTETEKTEKKTEKKKTRASKGDGEAAAE